MDGAVGQGVVEPLAVLDHGIRGVRAEDECKHRFQLAIDEVDKQAVGINILFQQLFRREAGAPLGGVAGGGHGLPGAGIDFQDLGQIRAGRSTKHTVPPSLSVPGRSPAHSIISIIIAQSAHNFQILRHRDLSAQKKMHCTKRQYIFQEEPGVFTRWPGRAGCGCGGTPGG